LYALIKDNNLSENFSPKTARNKAKDKFTGGKKARGAKFWEVRNRVLPEVDPS
jgi:hypothetical protein